MHLALPCSGFEWVARREIEPIEVAAELEVLPAWGDLTGRWQVDRDEWIAVGGPPTAVVWIDAASRASPK